MKFHPSSLRLAGLYLTVIMTISLFFSAVLYQTSIRELERGLRRPTPIVSRNPGISEVIRHQIMDEREVHFLQARQRIINQLLLINLLILVSGGALAYYLALRTIKPIEDAHESQSRFTADASHELRTPITAMRTENEVALLNPKLTIKEARQQIKSNVEELEKLTNLTEGLLRLAQIDNNHLQKIPVSLESITKQAIDRITPAAQNKDIRVKLTVKSQANVLADELSAVEALVTLLDNAVKYSPNKSEVTVSIDAGHKQGTVIISDSGEGIPAEQLPHIFERFYRGDASRNKAAVGGYGLGLAIADSIITAHHGTIQATSKQGKGTTFKVSLPQAQ